MSNKTRKWRSAIAMVLVISMLFSIFPTAAFAATGEDNEINYVSIGDSMANGYGFDGYKQNSNNIDDYDVMTGKGMYGKGAYPLQFEKYLTEQGYDVNHTKLATSAMLAEDLLYLLDGREEFDDGWGGFKDYIGNTYDVEDDLKPYFQEAIKEADVITMGIGNAAFGAFMLDRVTSAFGVFGASLDEDEKLKFEDAIDVLELDEEQYALAMELYNMMEDKLIASVPAEIVEEFSLEDVLGIVSYTATSYIVNYKLLVEKILDMNPDVEIILVGLLNTTYGMNITDENGNVLVAFGDMMDGTFDMLNAYMAGLPATMQAAGEWQDAKFYYAEQPAPKFICQEFAELKENGWVAVDSRLSGTTIRERNIEAFNNNLREIMGAPFVAGINGAVYSIVEDLIVDSMGEDFYNMSEVEQQSMIESAANEYGILLTEGTYGENFNNFLPDISLAEVEAFEQNPPDEFIENGNFNNDTNRKNLAIALYLGIEKGVAESTDTMEIPLEGLLTIATNIESAFEGFDTNLGSPASVADEMGAYLTTGEVLPGMCKIYGLFKVGNGMSVHPTPEGHDEIAASVIAAYGNHTAQDETIENLKGALKVAQDIIVEYYDEAYEYAYAYAKAEGYIEDATVAIDGVIAALKAIDLSGTDMTAEFKAEVAGEIAEIIETLEAAKALITAADKLDPEALETLQALLNEAGEDIAQLVAVLEQAGVDVNNLVIIPALEEAYEVLMNDVVPAIVADLEKAIAEGTEWLMDKAQDAIDAVIEALPEMAQFAHDYVYDFLLNNPEDVIAFFTAYGDEIIDVVGEYGEYALAAMGYIAVTYDQEILNFVMENHEEILEVTAMLLKEHGPHAAELIKVYAEATGLCTMIQNEIVKIEKEINELTAELEKELKVQLAMLNAQLENLYEQLETASGEAKAQIEAAIAELEALIEKVEAQIAAIEAMIADLEAKLAEAKEELVNALAELDALMAAIKDAIEAGAENIDEIIANVATAIDAVKNIIDRVEGIVDAINAKLAADKEDIIGAIGTAVEKLTNDWNALVEQFEVLKDAVNNIDELTAGLLSAINAYLENATQAALEELKDALYELAVATGDEIYWFLYNNPDKVVGFFEEYGDEIAALMSEYGDEALMAIGYLAMEYGDEIVAFAMEYNAEIIEVTAMLLEKHGENAAKLINVYAEYLGWCDAVRDVIADIEAQIDALEEKLADMYAQYENLKAQLEDLYAQLENASAEVKAEIEAAIAEIEALIAEVEKAIEEIENAIEALEAQLAAAKAELEKTIAAIEAVVEAIKTAIENGVETVEEILAVIEAIVDFAEETIAGVKTAVDGIVNAVEETVAFVEKLIANGIVAAEMIAEIIDTVMDIIDGVKAELEKGDIESAIEEIRNQLTNGYEELNAMLAAIDTAIAEELAAIVAGLEDALAMAQDEFEEALYNATHGEIACDAEYIYAVGGETVTADGGYAELLAEAWNLDFASTIDGADVILYQADPQIFVTALLESVSGEYAADWTKYISDESVLAYLEQAKAELVKELAAEYGEETAAMLEPIVDSFMFAVVEYAIANIETIEYLSEANEDALIVAVGMYNPVQGLSVTYNGETIDIEALCQYLIEVTDVYNLLYAIVAQNAVFVDVSEAEAMMMSNVDVDALLARAAELKAEAIALFAEAQKALEENDFAKASALMEQANALYTEIDNIVSEVLPLVEALDSNYATEAGHAYIAAQILAAIEKADHECEWAVDDNEHCYYCVNCGEEFVCGPHEFDGEEDAVCDVCGYERIIIDPTPEITTSSIVVYYLHGDTAIKETTVREITTTGSYRFNIPDPITFGGVEYLFNSLIDKDASDSYEAELGEGRFIVDVDVMPTTSSAIAFELRYIAAGGQGGPICVDSVAINPDSVSLKVGKTKALAAVINPENAQIASIEWTSSNDDVATVDQNGVVTAVAKGNATITVTVTDVDDCVVTATCAVTVTTSGGGGGGGFSGGGGGAATPLAKHEAFIGGYPDGNFAPDKQITRGEVAAIFARLLADKAEAGKVYTSTFKDVPADLWSASSIGLMQSLGMLSGYEDGTFRPEQPITRAELIALVCRFKAAAPGVPVFNDVPSTHWAYNDINAAAAQGWTGGYEDGSFRPGQPITRAEVVSILCRVLDRNADAEYITERYVYLPNTFKDINSSHWAYWNVMEAANGHEYKVVRGAEDWAGLIK